MTAFIIHNMAPIMFAALVAFLLLGYPVAFSLAANGLLYALPSGGDATIKVGYRTRAKASLDTLNRFAVGTTFANSLQLGQNFPLPAPHLADQLLALVAVKADASAGHLKEHGEDIGLDVEDGFNFLDAQLGHAGLDRRRHVGQHRRALGRAHRECRELALLHMRDCSGRTCEREIDMTAKQVRRQRAGAAIGDDGIIDTGQ